MDSQEIYCKKLLNTYNASFISKLDEDLRNAFKDQRIEGKKCTKVNTRKVLKQLIFNHFNKTDGEFITDFITGPLNLTVHYSEKFQKIIYIFGENHGDSLDCPSQLEKRSKNIYEYLNTVVRNNDAFIDFLIEVPIIFNDESDDPKVSYEEKYFSKSQEHLNVLGDKFIDCLEKKGTCESTCRVQAIDIRQIIGNVKTNIMSLFINKIDGYLKSPYVQNLFNKDVSKNPRIALNYIKILIEMLNDNIIQVVINTFAENNDKDFTKFWEEQCDHFNYLYEVLESKTWNPIFVFIKNEMLIVSEKYKQTIFEASRIIKKDYTEIKTCSKEIEIQKYIDDLTKIYINIRTLYYNVINVNRFIMDIYTMYLVFKTYEDHEVKEAHNIIIYAGFLHSQTYRDVLESIDFHQIGNMAGERVDDKKVGTLDERVDQIDEMTCKKVDDKKVKPKQILSMYCIDMKNIKQPFFSDWPPTAPPDPDTT